MARSKRGPASAKSPVGERWTRRRCSCRYASFPCIRKSEILRGGLRAVPKGTQEAARVKSESELATLGAPLDRLIEVTGALGFLVLGYGIQPLTSRGRGLLSPKRRYQVLSEVAPDLWDWFTVSASDQVHVDITREEIVEVMNLCHLVTGAVVAFCANSPIHSGRDSGFCSAREEGKRRTAEVGRHGVPPSPDGSLEEYLQRLSRLRHLMIERGDGYLPAAGTFADRPVEPDVEWEDFLFHEHYIWNSARPRTTHSTLELRASCQQPEGSHMAATALGLGIVENWRSISDWISGILGSNAWSVLVAHHQRALKEGLAAVEPFVGYLEGVLATAREGLRGG